MIYIMTGHQKTLNIVKEPESFSQKEAINFINKLFIISPILFCNKRSSLFDKSYFHPQSS